MKKTMIALMGLAAAGIASAADVYVDSNITSSTVWTADNVYFLDDVIYVEPGASLIIEPGTLIRGSTSGSLNVSPLANIYANGTKDAPITFTSEDDVDPADPTNTSKVSPTFREGFAGEWGAVTIMGKALIAGTLDNQGTGQPDGTDTMQMEGLSAAGSLSLFGGNDDNDDSGNFTYVSLRYGGLVLSQANELNGLSLGGIGRETDIHHVEILNNKDDGIEIWGGTVGLKYVSIWNIGDDSFDLDCGYRGKAQFGLIVQGACDNAKQGDGVGDNCFEMDGAENSAAQPHGAALIYNFTTIGQPANGDQGTEWRDNMRAQFRNCVFMDIGDKMIKDGTSGGDGGGYEAAGYSLAGMFTTPYNTYPINSVGVDPTVLYPNFTDGYWAEFKDCVFYNLHETATLSTFGQTDPSKRNIIAASSPVVSVMRGDDNTNYFGIAINFVTNLNPCAANDAVSSAYPAPNDGFFSPAQYKGAFSPNHNWLAGWTAVDMYGMTVTSMNDQGPAAEIEFGAMLSFQSAPGVTYVVEQRDSLTGNDWEYFATVIGDGSFKSVGDADLADAGYYRVVVQ